MAILLVTYDLNAQGQDYDSVRKYFEQYAYAKALKSAWLIETRKTVQDIFSEFRQVVDQNDTFFVSRVFRPHFEGVLNKEIVDWVNSSDRDW